MGPGLWRSARRRRRPGRLDRAHPVRRDARLRSEGDGEPAALPLAHRTSPLACRGSRPWRTAGLTLRQRFRAAPLGGFIGNHRILKRRAAGRVVRIRSQDGLSLAVTALRCSDVRSPAPPLPSRPFAKFARFPRARQLFLRAIRPSRAASSRSTIAAAGFPTADPNWRNYKPHRRGAGCPDASPRRFGIERAIARRHLARRDHLDADRRAAPDADRRRRAQRYRPGARRHRPRANQDLSLDPAFGQQSGTRRSRSSRSASESAVPRLCRRTTGERSPRPTLRRHRPGLLRSSIRTFAKSIVDIDVTEKIPVLWPQFMSLARVPVLAIRGEHSDLLSPRTLAEMADAIRGFEQSDGLRPGTRAASARRADAAADHVIRRLCEPARPGDATLAFDLHSRESQKKSPAEAGLSNSQVSGQRSEVTLNAPHDAPDIVVCRRRRRIAVNVALFQANSGPIDRPGNRSPARASHDGPELVVVAVVVFFGLGVRRRPPRP